MAKKKSHNKSTSSSGSVGPLPWVGGALLVLGLAIAAGFYWNSNMKVHQVYYEGNSFVSNEQLKKVDVPTGIHPDSLNTISIIKEFEKIPYVKRAAVNVEPSGNITIQISERQPIAMLSGSSGKIYIDQDGIRLPMVLDKAVNVPLLYGFSTHSTGDTLSGSSADKTVQFLNELRKNPVSDATISEVAWTDNGIVALTNPNGVKLIFGQDNFADRLRNWEAFYGKVIKQKGIEHMQSIDLRFQGQIVTREK